MKMFRYLLLLFMLGTATILSSENGSFLINELITKITIPKIYPNNIETNMTYDTVKIKKHIKIGNDTAITKFYSKLENLNDEQNDSIVIFHLGDSHIKGKFFTNSIAKRFNNDYENVKYHIYGLNGASFRTFCKKTEYLNLIEELKPDLVIISLGTNDASGNTITERSFLDNVDEVIYSIREAYPLTEILLTTPPDYIKKGEINRNIPLLNRFLIKYCEENFTAYWDLYEAMGGEGSVLTWAEEGLMAKDRIQLTKEGYEKQAEMFYKDLMYSEYQ